MTALCSGGTSSSKTGVADTIIFTAGALSSLLNNKGGYWATLAAPLLGVLAYEATSLCSTDPPAQPTITDVEYQALLQLGPWDDLQSALIKLKDIATRLIWFDMCECDSVATPALPVTTLDPPANVTIPQYGGTGSCPQPRARLGVPLVTASPIPPYANVTRILFPGFPIYQSVTDAVNESQDIILIPPNWTTLLATSDLVSGTTTGSFGYAVTIQVFNSGRTTITSVPNVVVTSGTPHKVQSGGPYTINHSTARYLSVITQHVASGIAVDGVVDYQLEIGCSGASSSGLDCCSDPSVIALLSQLMQQVNLIQRQQVPFAYVPGSAHSGLTGTGEITVQGLLGALVELTTVSTVVGEESGTPDQTFEAGWIAWGNADGFSAREFITNESLLSLPPLAGQYTRLGYTLSVGVVATITELVREP